MTAVGVPARVRPPRVTRIRLPAAGRLLRLELRRNAMIWMLPLLAALFWLDTYRRATGQPPLWTVRSMTMQWRALFEFLPLAAGVAAWTGSRDGRRRITDLVAVTARPRWARQLSSWAATTCWAQAAYLGCAAVLYGVTAARATWGGPLWWPLAVGATCIAAVTALGFAAGTLLPSRFTPPLVVVTTMTLLVVVSAKVTANGNAYGRLSPLSTDTLGSNAGIFHPFVPDLSIVQLMFYGGIAVAVLSALGLPAVAGGRRQRAAAAVVTVAALAAAGTGARLAGTSYATADGVVIPVVHDAASDRPISYPPACERGRSAIPICLHPAVKAYLPTLTAALDPLLGEVAGLPGAPVRVTQTAGLGEFAISGMTSGSPPVLYLTVFVPIDTVPGRRYTTANFVDVPQLAAATTITQTVIGLDASGGGSLAQQAAAAGLLAAANVPLPPPGNGFSFPGQMPAPGSPAYAAAQRFAALPAATRHTWLAAHLPALRTGHLSLAQMP